MVTFFGHSCISIFLVKGKGMARKEFTCCSRARAHAKILPCRPFPPFPYHSEPKLLKAKNSKTRYFQLSIMSPVQESRTNLISIYL